MFYNNVIMQIIMNLRNIKKAPLVYKNLCLFGCSKQKRLQFICQTSKKSTMVHDDIITKSF